MLADQSMPVSPDTLATAVAQRETVDTDGPPPTERVATALHHIHLPRIADMNLVDYESGRNRINACRYNRRWQFTS